MKLFIDSADPKEVKIAWDWGIVDGVTTNPTLAAKVGKPYSEIVNEITAIVDGPISLEVIATEYNEILDQAHKLSKINNNIIVKIPCTQDGLKAVKQLKKEGIRTNVTLVFSLSQAMLAAKVGADYCSPFVGRVNDVAEESGFNLISNIRKVYDLNGYKTKILAASVRDTNYVEKVAELGADVATVPLHILEDLVKHSLTDKGLESFLNDWEKSGLKLPFEN